MSRIASELSSAIRQKSQQIDIEFAKAALQFLKDGDHAIFDSLPDPMGRKGQIEAVLINLLQPYPNDWTEENDTASRFKFEIWKRGGGTYYREMAVTALGVDANILYFQAIAGKNTQLSVFMDRLKVSGMDDATMARVLVCRSPRYVQPRDLWFSSLSESEPLWRTEMETFLWQRPDEEFAEYALTANRGDDHLWPSILRHRPTCVDIFVEQLSKLPRAYREPVVQIWGQIIKTSAAHDSEVLSWMAAAEYRSDKETLLNGLVRERPAIHLERYLDFISSGEKASNQQGIFHTLADVAPRPALYNAMKRHLATGRNSDFKCYGGPNVIAIAAEDILGDANEFFALFLDEKIPPPFPDDLSALVKHAPPEADDLVYQIAARAFEADKDNINRREWYWGALRSRPTVAIRFRDDFIQGLSDARIRSGAKSLLKVAVGDSGFQELVDEMWGSKNEKKRLVAIRSVAEGASEADKQKLLGWLSERPSKKLSGIIRELLVKWSISIPEGLAPEHAKTAPAPAKEKPQVPEDITGFPGFEAWVAANGKRLRLPKMTWCDPNGLPPVVSKYGVELSRLSVSSLIALQSKRKEISGVPEAGAVFAEVDREKSAPFATALVDGFLNSDQAAADRWALTLGGLLGDKRIIPPLLSRIPDWCDNSRHKLAEYAAQAISLLPGDEPLMVLDSLSNRYRSKFKNVGRACAEAFNAAATARGITPDELGDMVVPDFGFDSEGVRRFDWDGGGVSAELGADFKLTWFDPETEKTWKSLPANAPDEVKAEVKTLTKLVRETVKAQTARLEMSLVRQRRWPVARWRELYEGHPLLRSFASGLVWGVYDASGSLLRTFRRYANGILADAAGTMEELADADAEIGMVHPLELDSAAVAAWHAHLSRMKVKPPIPQMDRPVELMDPLHGNRREISLSHERKLSAGTFRSRAEKRGWTRGSVIDGGGISSYYKLYPGAGVEVNLPTEGFWIGCDPMDTVTLGAACFAKAGTIERGSYIYNEPKPDDPRVLRFDQVPPVVYSETLSDLKAIIATKE